MGQDFGLDADQNPLAALAAAVAANRLGFTPWVPSVSDIDSGQDTTPYVDDKFAQTDERIDDPQVDPRVMIEELSALHCRQLVELQGQHEEEVESLRATTQARYALYQQEIVRLRELVTQLQPTTLGF